MKKKTSILWKISKENMEKIVKMSNSLSGILKHFNLYHKGGNAKTLKNRLNYDKIDYSHIRLGTNSNINRKICREGIPLEQIMVEKSRYNRTHLKRRLINENILQEKCSICGQLPIHNNKKLVMVMDHINGISNDNRLENLRLLCPNCNSQTDTFCGKHTRKKYYCLKCGGEKRTKKSKYCLKCSLKYERFSRRVSNRPSIDVLLEEVKKLGYCGVGRKYGVSDNAIRKWIGIKK